MRLLKSFVLSALFVCCVSLPVKYLYAASHSCSAGTFYNDGCTKCMKGCYCSHNGTVYDIDWPFSGISDSEVSAWCSSGTNCPDAYKKSDKGEYGACGRSSSAGIYKCPSGFEKSDEGKTSASDCFAEVGSKRLYYVKHTCVSGEYLPINSDTCAKCKTGTQDYCPGVKDVYPSTSQDQGLLTCDSGKKANSNHSGCETAKVEAPKYKCIAGEYLPANSTSCAACPVGKLCLGGEWEQRSIAQGDDGKCPDDDHIINDKGSACNVPCPTGKKANSAHTECSGDVSVSVPAGSYLPANSVKTKTCPARKFCPGGTFNMSSMDQGAYDCPNGGVVSDDKKSCVLTLTKEQMRCGQQGSKKDDNGIYRCVSSTPCWLKTDTEDYINCIYGVRFEVQTE
jgi:hypothetical protein